MVHAALAGIFYLPLIFLALRMVQKRVRVGKPWKVWPAALLLLGATFSPHYYIIIWAVLSPLLLWFFLRDRGTSGWVKPLASLAAASVPALLFLSWNFLVLMSAGCSMP